MAKVTPVYVCNNIQAVLICCDIAGPVHQVSYGRYLLVTIATTTNPLPTQ